MNWALRSRLYPIARRAFTLSRFHWFFGRRLSRLAVWFAGLSELSRFRHENPMTEFNARYYHSREDLYAWLVERERLGPIDYLEFGVAEGHSFRWWASAVKDPGARFVGFDLFTGLPEAWGRLPAGTFDQGGKTPQLDDGRTSFRSGIFQETLPSFLADFRRRERLVVHIDADLYSSTLFVLSALAPVFRAGDLVLFDELGSLSYPDHEFRAFRDFCSAFKIGFLPLASSSNFQQVAFRVT